MKEAIESLYSMFLEAGSLATDTRKIDPGCIFLALKGDNFDGNAFAADALAKGARFAVIDDPSFASNDKMLLVDDTLTTLQQLAEHHRKQLTIPVIGITGTNGKTTTKELIHAVLSTKYQALATKGNFNNHIGVPLTLLSIKPTTEIAIVEMGANHEGEIASLCRIARPGFGLITNIGKAHLEGFGSFEGVIRAKSELYAFIRENGGRVFLNADNELLTRLAGKITSVTYGAKAGTYCHGWPEEAHPYAGVQWNSPNGLHEIKTKLVGGYNFENIMAAICVGQYFGVGLNDIISAISAYKPANNRSQTIETENNHLIMDAYNANPTSMKAAILNFRQVKSLAKMAIIGDMLELGDESPKEHAEVIRLLDESDFETVILVGPRFVSTVIPQHFLAFASPAEAKKWLKKYPVKKHTILVKGSRGIHLEELTDAL
jgi:UDP-N-acetylmuramoyl-tripeptide--D-alanyl-D-alanine ligase